MIDFLQVEKRFKQLKEQFEAGTLTEADFKNQLEELMIQDEQGSWWMIGYETERWYRNEGTDWVQADPPIDLSQKATRSSNWVAIFWIALGFAIGWAIGGGIVQAILWAVGDVNWLAQWGIASAIGGGIGGLVTAIALRNKHLLSNRKSMLWITLGWAAGAALGGLGTDGVLSGPIVGAIGWGMGGFVTAISLQNEHMLSNRRSTLWIILGWAAGAAIGWTIDRPFVGEIRGTLGWAIGGGIGGLVTIWQIKKG